MEQSWMKYHDAGGTADDFNSEIWKQHFPPKRYRAARLHGTASKRPNVNPHRHGNLKANKIKTIFKIKFEGVD
jgi:hypothetical protein